ncbi:MAG: mannose-1-phosphate guanylyltransferase/mannose-6-phosphate isomerase [Pseudomonadota bacterium]
MIYPVLLCGGSGTRLWPLSRKSYPKQFADLTGDQSLFQASAARLSGPGFAAPLIVTASDFRFIVAEQIQAIGIDPGAILLEPAGRNTAPAVLAAALHVAAQDADALLLVSPSDHAIPDTAAFRTAVEEGAKAARKGQLVTFGVSPTRPETGYGYLELAAPLASGDGSAVPLKSFIEKPDAPRAEAMVAGGKHLWNSGIFLFRAADIITAFERDAPALLAPVRAALEGAKPDLGFVRLAPDPWETLEDISVDYAVMERAPNLAVVPFPGQWSDLGGWEAVWRESVPDMPDSSSTSADQGVITRGPATAIDCTDTLLRSESDTLELVGLGLRNVVAVAMTDAVLIADMDRAQDVKSAVTALRAKRAPQADKFPRHHRPWGWFDSLVLADRFQVKRIHVRPGAALSLQSHHHRSEHWIVVEGTAKVTIDGKEEIVSENQSVYVPLGAHHRLENPGKLPMVLIEVQTGSYLGEDDIIRYEDLYARG